MNKQVLAARILTPEATLYEGPVEAVVSVNKTGEFSILPNHTNFISVIQDKVVIHKSNKDYEEFPVKKGVMSFRNNLIEVFIDE